MSFPSISGAATQVTLAWDANSEPDLIAYRVYCGESSRSYNENLTKEVSSDTTTCEFTDLKEGITYYFAAKAVSQTGESDYSQEISYTVPAAPADPQDIDNDGDGLTENQGDCNDADAGIGPNAEEVCGDGIDQDCNGSDELCPEDVDNDGDGLTENQGDCNDADAGIGPNAEEVCGDGIDQDCNGSDELCPEDVDNDGDGLTENQGDCNDADAGIGPNAEEVCGDGIDQDCNGSDELCPEDVDNDGDGLTENQGDCNDADAGIGPNAEEVCGDGIDQVKWSDKLCGRCR